jgi:hypothetical protein
MLCMRPAYELSQSREIHVVIYTLQGYAGVAEGCGLLSGRGVGCRLGEVPHRAIEVARALRGLGQFEVLQGAGWAGDGRHGRHGVQMAGGGGVCFVSTGAAGHGRGFFLLLCLYKALPHGELATPA